ATHSPWLGAVVGLFCGLLALLGDLSVSILKRQVGVKDSGHVFPGHGGMLDRMDSPLFVLPFIYQMVTLWQRWPGYTSCHVPRCAAFRSAAIFSATGARSLKTALPTTNTFAPFRTTSSMLCTSMPPSTSTSHNGLRSSTMRRTRRSLFVVVSIKRCE